MGQIKRRKIKRKEVFVAPRNNWPLWELVVSQREAAAQSADRDVDPLWAEPPTGRRRGDREGEAGLSSDTTPSHESGSSSSAKQLR